MRSLQSYLPDVRRFIGRIRGEGDVCENHGRYGHRVESADERVGRSRRAFVHAVEERREDRGVVRGEAGRVERERHVGYVEWISSSSRT